MTPCSARYDFSVEKYRRLYRSRSKHVAGRAVAHGPLRTRVRSGRSEHVAAFPPPLTLN